MAYVLDEQACKNPEVSSRREWLLTNGLGGFAMGTASGINTRRYHGHLVAATQPPATRMVLLAGVDAFVQTDANPTGISANQYPGTIFPEGYLYLHAFSAGEAAVWQFRGPGLKVDKVLRIHPGLNAVTLEYINFADAPVLLTLRPLVCHKFYHANFYEHAGYPENMAFPKNGTVIEQDGVSLFLGHPGAQRSPVQGWYYRFEHAREAERGLDSRDDLFCHANFGMSSLPGNARVSSHRSSNSKRPLASSSSKQRSARPSSPAIRGSRTGAATP